MSEEYILSLILGAFVASYAAGVYFTTWRATRLPYLAITMGLGAAFAIMPKGDIAAEMVLLMAGMFLHGMAVGGRTNDAGMSKLHALWAWMPIVFIGLAFPKSKET